MDDRGKYIYIAPEEMKAVADYIKRQGRVSISHLASKSNQFIDLEPKPQFDEQNSDGIAVAQALSKYMWHYISFGTVILYPDHEEMPYV